jgi:hypothetical protein
MVLSELLADLTNRQKTAQVLVVEPDLLQRVGPIMIESVAKEGNEKAVVLMGKAAMKSPVDEIFSQIVEDLERGKHTSRVFSAGVHKSEKDGKYEVSIDGSILQSGIETEQEGRLFVRGYVVGFEMGASGKGLNAADSSGV